MRMRRALEVLLSEHWSSCCVTLANPVVDNHNLKPPTEAAGPGSALVWRRFWSRETTYAMAIQSWFTRLAWRGRAGWEVCECVCCGCCGAAPCTTTLPSTITRGSEIADPRGVLSPRASLLAPSAAHTSRTPCPLQPPTPTPPCALHSTCSRSSSPWPPHSL